ncbi:MAG: serine hydrolase [Phycisphaerales bacterium]|nr:serine hydrolase [Phycisphaerales bacterium]
MKSLVKLAFVSCFISLFSVAVFADGISQDRIDRLDKTLQEWQTEYKIPGLAIAVIYDNQPILMKGYGFADIKSERPVTPETIFAVGSTTKAFTSALIAMEIDQGVMAWDDPITKFLPDFQLQIETDDPDAKVLMTDLLSHQTGFTRMGLLWAGGQASDKVIMETAISAEPLAPFRKRFLYNNVMYMVAGQGLAQAAGQSWRALLESRIFKPLGMTSSTTSVKEAQKDDRLATGYYWNDEKSIFKTVPMRDLLSVAAAGAINSNVKDMAQWLRLQLGKGQFNGTRLIDAARFDEMWEGRITIAGETEYGLGWMVHNEGDDLILEHGGNIDGFAASVAIRPQDGLGYVLLCNVSATPLQAMYETVFDLLLNDQVDEEPALQVVEPLEMLEPYVGTYKANFGPFVNADFVVSESEGNLYIDVPGQMNYQLVAPDDQGRRYFAMTREIFVTFDENNKGDVSALRMHQNGLAFDMPREGVLLIPEIPISLLEPYLGTYEMTEENEGPVLTVLIQGLRLAVDVPGQMIYELESPDESGRRAFRVKESIGVVFKDGQTPHSMTMLMEQDGQIREFHRTKTAEGATLPTLAELDQLRGTAKRGETLASFGVLGMEWAINMKQSGVSGAAKHWLAGTDRARTDIDFGIFGLIEMAVDGDTASERSSFEPFKQLSGRLLRQAQQSHPGFFLGDWHDFYENITVVRRTTLEDQPAILLLLENDGAPSVECYVDSNTGDVLQFDTVAIQPGMGEFPVSVLLADYREVRGLRIPHVMTTKTVEAGDMIMSLQDVKTNLKIGDGIFHLVPREKEHATP